MDAVIFIAQGYEVSEGHKCYTANKRPCYNWLVAPCRDVLTAVKLICGINHVVTIITIDVVHFERKLNG